MYSFLNSFRVLEISFIVSSVIFGILVKSSSSISLQFCTSGIILLSVSYLHPLRFTVVSLGQPDESRLIPKSLTRQFQ